MYWADIFKRDLGSHICRPHRLTWPQLLNGMTSSLGDRVIEGQVSPEPDLQVDELLCQSHSWEQLRWGSEARHKRLGCIPRTCDWSLHLQECRSGGMSLFTCPQPTGVRREGKGPFRKTLLSWGEKGHLGQQIYETPNPKPDDLTGRKTVVMSSSSCVEHCRLTSPRRPCLRESWARCTL